MNLRFTRKLGRSEKNKGSVLTIPRIIAQAWSQYRSIDLVFDGSTLVVIPKVD